MSLSWPWTGLLRDLVVTRGSEQQLCGYMAVLSGVRRALDDWIDLERFEAYARLARRLGLAVEVDCVFESLDVTTSVLGSNFMPTTRARASRYPPASARPGASVHVLVAGSPDAAQEALASCWYSVAVHDRIIRKPLVDHERFGRALGYPPCCIAFFAQHSNLALLNTPAAIAAGSSRLRWEANCLTKHTPWMTSFHMPCRFDCAVTVEQTVAVLAEVAGIDPAYAGAVERFARRHFLMVNEVVCYALAGSSQEADGRWRYDTARFVGYGLAQDRYADQLAAGDRLRVEDGTIHVWRGDELIHSLETSCADGIMDVPAVLSFD